MNGPRWAHASIGCLFALAVLLVLYSWIVAVREDARGKIYLTATFLVLAVAALGNGTAWSPAGPSFKVFLVAVSFVLYTPPISSNERDVWRSARQSDEQHQLRARQSARTERR